MTTEKEKRCEEFENIYCTDLGMCGCGMPDEVQKFIFSLLQIQQLAHKEVISWEECEARRREIITKAHPDVIFEFMFHVFGNADLVEHGTSVYGSWLTDKGEKFMELLQEQIEDPGGCDEC